MVYRDRHHLRGDVQPEQPPDSHPLGHTRAGGLIAGPVESRYAPTSITVRAGGRLTSYELSGGP